ncbi:MAG: serine/threonine-protein kinase [Planctomycetaceae bacterium]
MGSPSDRVDRPAASSTPPAGEQGGSRAGAVSPLDFPSQGDQLTSGGGSVGAEAPEFSPSQFRSQGDQSTLPPDDSFGDLQQMGDLAREPDDELQQIDLTARYELLGEAGRGGMGRVLKARDRRLNRLVAIKRVRTEFGASRQARARFLTEARSIAQVNHFNIVQVYDYGRDADGPFLILEFVEGPTLAENLLAGPLDVETAIDVACQLCDGLAKAHEKGIIHRDIKPANILLTADGNPKLTDFGLARQMERDDGHTKTNVAMGTLDFMAPEQRRDASGVDSRCDLYSVGATLYQMLTGRSPRVIRIDDLPAGYREVIARTLEEDRDRRPASARALYNELRQARAHNRSRVGGATLAEGACPACGVINEVARKFCRGCRAALVTTCVAESCGNPELKVWDDVCGECGAGQQELVGQLREEIETQLDQAESLGREYRFDSALTLCASAMERSGSRWPELTSRATELHANLTAASDRERKLCVAIEADVGECVDRHDYTAALRELDRIPAPLLSSSAAQRSEQCRAAIKELASLNQTIRQRISAKALTGLSELTARYLELDPNHAAIRRLHERLTKRDQDIVAVVASAQACYDTSDDRRCLNWLRRIPEGTDAARDALHRAASLRLQQVQLLEQQLADMPAAAVKLALLREYVALRPGDEARGSELAGLAALVERRRRNLMVVGAASTMIVMVATIWGVSKLWTSLATITPDAPPDSVGTTAAVTPSPRVPGSPPVATVPPDRLPSATPTTTSTDFTNSPRNLPVTFGRRTLGGWPCGDVHDGVATERAEPRSRRDARQLLDRLLARGHEVTQGSGR